MKTMLTDLDGHKLEIDNENVDGQHLVSLTITESDNEFCNVIVPVEELMAAVIGFDAALSRNQSKYE